MNLALLKLVGRVLRGSGFLFFLHGEEMVRVNPSISTASIVQQMFDAGGRREEERKVLAVDGASQTPLSTR